MLDEVELKEIKIKLKGLRIHEPVNDLIESIRAIGLLQPLVLNSNKELIAGGRRYAALKKLNYKKVPVIWIEKSSLDQEIAHLDENLIRSDLKGFEYQEAIARRYDLYLQKYPDRKTGRSGGLVKHHGKSAIAKSANAGFVEQTSQVTGDSKRQIYSLIERSKNSSDSVKRAHKANKISDSQVQALILLDKKEQEIILPKIIKKDFGLLETETLVSEIKSRGISEVNKNLDYIAKWKSKFDFFKRIFVQTKDQLKLCNEDEINFEGGDGFLLWVEGCKLADELRTFLDRHEKRGVKKHGKAV